MFYVYLLSSKPLGTLYVGMTADLAKRIREYKVKAVPGFTALYGVDRLVWYEQHDLLEAAFVRERQIKKWKRAWKIQLIETDNPHWIDLYSSIAVSDLAEDGSLLAQGRQQARGPTGPD